MAPADGSDPGAAVQAHLFKHLCRHFVSLQGLVGRVGPGGKVADVREQRFFACSGFVVRLFGTRMWMTAGHVLKELDDLLGRDDQRLSHCCFVDYHGGGGAHQEPIQFNYADSVRWYVDDGAAGIDVGFIRLGPHYQRLLEANGIVAVGEENWLSQHEVSFEQYGMLGLPAELHEREKKLTAGGRTIAGATHEALMMLNPSDAKPLEYPDPTYPWFVGELRDKTRIKDIEGMSGGPIFGFRGRPDGGLHYWVVAVQSRWDAKRRIIYGTHVPTVMAVLTAEAVAAFPPQEPKRPRRRRKKK
jgi:hypothetical protein